MAQEKRKSSLARVVSASSSQGHWCAAEWWAVWWAGRKGCAATVLGLMGEVGWDMSGKAAGAVPLSLRAVWTLMMATAQPATRMAPPTLPTIAPTMVAVLFLGLGTCLGKGVNGPLRRRYQARHEEALRCTTQPSLDPLASSAGAGLGLGAGEGAACTSGSYWTTSICATVEGGEG